MSQGNNQSDDGRASAVAISYDTSDAAPRVVAKGYGTVAENIIRTAKDHGLHVHESPELVGLLMQVDLDAHIPPELYLAIAELLAWLYALEGNNKPEAT
ncbi:EscU/YscU/HrcU family type III secretion system export apparatus switch protein [Pollutimonas harenae]|uniref:EscU/YscU/HrcU family type III secretion system export apparatus switch protein n=1 Tax=Pollutimonas harenae TaxID=657015 RepID=A0A853H6U8_9BURK|nr:EscU/YscU/HrcU family type III secretion system export apparatus switch protein [Pollutimonas harenae]NYT86233.1 EscU/YscU/HrcU family type III secretion system export apparatus switch protein [Pollutimonas harenae]TEA71264.1 flagellar biosynthesis protein FlhB [Pollutimonas harenae]